MLFLSVTIQVEKNYSLFASESEDLSSLFFSIPLDELKKQERINQLIFSLYLENPSIINSSLIYSVNFPKIMDEQIRLLELLHRNHQDFVKEWQSKSLKKISISKYTTNETKTIQHSEKFTSDWKNEILKTLNSLPMDNIQISNLEILIQEEINQIDSLDTNGFFNGLILSLSKEKQSEARSLSQQIDKSDLIKYLKINLPEKLDKFKSSLTLAKDKLTLVTYIEEKTQNIQKIMSLVDIYLLLEQKKINSEESFEQFVKSMTAEEVNHFIAQDFSLLLESNFSSDLTKHYKHYQNYFLKIQTQSSESSTYKKTLSLVEQNPFFAIFRGCSADDCSTTGSFPYPNDPSERVFFIYDENNKGLLGYISSTLVKDKNNPQKNILYISTIAGKRITTEQTEDILNSLFLIKKDLGVDEIYIPTKDNIDALINYNNIKSYFLKSIPKSEKNIIKAEIVYPHSKIRDSIEAFTSNYNSANYDHQEKNRQALRFNPTNPSNTKNQKSLKEVYKIQQDSIPFFYNISNQQFKNLSKKDLFDGIIFFYRYSPKDAQTLAEKLTKERPLLEVIDRLINPQHRYNQYKDFHDDVKFFFKSFSITKSEQDVFLGLYFSDKATQLATQYPIHSFLDFHQNILIQSLIYKQKVSNNTIHNIALNRFNLQDHPKFSGIIDRYRKKLNIDKNDIVSSREANSLYIAFLNDKTGILQEEKFINFLKKQLSLYSHHALLYEYLKWQDKADSSLLASQLFLIYLLKNFLS